MRHLIRMLLTAAAALGAVIATGGGAEAAFVFTFQQQGADPAMDPSTWPVSPILAKTYSMPRASARTMLSPA